MRQETFALSQKELQRVAVISRCVKGELACARAAGLLCLSGRQIKGLKKRLREGGGGALAPRQSWAAQPPPSARCRARTRPAAGTRHLRRLQRSPSMREACRARGDRAESRDPAPPVAPARTRLA